MRRRLGTAKPSPVLAAGAKVEKLVGGFFNISGGAVDHSGDFYFVDARWQMIYRWSAASRQLSIVRDNPLDPVQLAFDKVGKLMVVSYRGQRHGLRVQTRSTDFDQIDALAAANQPTPSRA